MQELITEYKQSKAELKHIQATTDQEQSLINGMGRDMDYAIEWMETGRRPGSKRGIERLAAYQREIPTDIIEKYMQPTPKLETGAYDEQHYYQMEFILAMLTDRERECFEMHVGGMVPMREIAKSMGISFTTVQQFLKRAEAKVKKYKHMAIPQVLELDMMA